MANGNSSFNKMEVVSIYIYELLWSHVNVCHIMREAIINLLSRNIFADHLLVWECFINLKEKFYEKASAFGVRRNVMFHDTSIGEEKNIQLYHHLSCQIFIVFERNSWNLL